MTTKYNKAIITFFFLFIVLALPLIGLAQIDTSPGNPDEAAPIDGGLSLLVAAGVGYGAKKMKARRDSKISGSKMF